MKPEKILAVGHYFGNVNFLFVGNFSCPILEGTAHPLSDLRSQLARHKKY